MYLHKYIHEDPETTEKRRYPSAPFCNASELFRSLGNGPRKFLYYHTPAVNATIICRRFEIGVVAGGGPLGRGLWTTVTTFTMKTISNMLELGTFSMYEEK